MKPPIPAYRTDDADLRRFTDTVKLHLDTASGQTANSVKLKPLPATATNAEIVAQLNAILVRLQG